MASVKLQFARLSLGQGNILTLRGTVQPFWCMSINHWRVGLAVVMLAQWLVLTSCVPVHVASSSDPPLAGQRIKPDDITFIKAGITSREEVIAKLGPPTVDLSDLRTLVYVWIELKEQWVGVIPLGVATAPRTADLALLVALDENNRVVRAGIDQRSWADTVISQTRKWAEAQKVALPPTRSSFAPVPIPEGKALVYVYRTKPPASLGSRFFPPQSFVWPLAIGIDTQYVSEMHDDTFAMVSVSPGRHEFFANPFPPYRYPQYRGNLAIDPSKRQPGSVTVDVRPEQPYFIEVFSGSAMGDDGLTTSLTLRSESEAMPVLRSFRPTW